MLEPELVLAADPTGAGRWTLKDVTEHDVLSVGVRMLQASWAAAQEPLVVSRYWRRALRRQLLEDLAAGKRDLRALPGNEVSKSQPRD